MNRQLNKLNVLILAAATLFQTAAVSFGNPTDFTVTSPDGKAFKLSEHKNQFVAIHFLLKTECPFCIRYTREYAKQPAMTNLAHVFLKPDSEEEIKKWTTKTSDSAPEFPVTIYRDPDASLAEQYAIPGGFNFHGQTVHFPAVVLLEPGGKEIFRYIGKDNSDRYPMVDLLKKVSNTKPMRSASMVKEYNLGANNLALAGYDPVTYITVGKPVIGKKEITTNFGGVTYQFSNEENKKVFLAGPPEKYEPAYGGWCATAMAKGEKVEIDPTNFKVTNGRLFLFFKAFYGNAIKDWNKDEPSQIAKADLNWTKIAGN